MQETSCDIKPSAVRNITLFTFAHIAIFMVFWLIQMNLTQLAYQLTASPFLLGLLGFAINIPLVILMPFAGVLSDRVPRLTLVMICALCYLLPNAIFFALAKTQTISYLSMILIGSIYGILVSIAKPSADALVYDIANDDKQLKVAVSLYSATRQIPLLFTPALSAIVITYFQLPGIFAVCMLCNITATCLLFFVKPNQNHHLDEEVGHAFWSALKRGFMTVYDNSTLRRYVFLISCALAIAISLQFQYPALIARLYQGQASDLYYFYFYSALGGILGATIVLLKPVSAHHSKWVIIASLMVQALALAAFALAKSLWICAALIFIIDVAAMVVTIVGTIAVQNLVADAVRGRVMSVLNLARIGAIPLASIFLGVFSQLLPMPLAMAVFGGVYLLLIVYLAGSN